VITLHQALRGEVSWGAALAARVDLLAFADPRQLAKLPRYVQPIFARLAGRDAPIPGEGATAEQRLVIAAERVLAGAGVSEIAHLIGTAPYAEELRRVVATRAPFSGDARTDAATRHALLAVRETARPDELRAIVVAYLRDPAIADRLGRDAVARATDAAAMHATLAALFDALGDPARARAAWQAAVDASPEPAFVRGLAEAQARQGDPDAALITATTAAAASGDPAIVWTGVARALAGAGRYVHALDAARSAIDLSGQETLADALAVAIAASQALGRDAQAASLTEQRARVAKSRTVGDNDPTDAVSALAAYKQRASGDTIARMWVASRWNPREVELRAALLGATTSDDARHAVITGELVDLAGDRDPVLRRAAVAALRHETATR
jgi:tetratricopeptide (TPR) repeat protein